MLAIETPSSHWFFCSDVAYAGWRRKEKTLVIRANRLIDRKREPERARKKPDELR